jgi:hypothetical protein
MRKSQAICSRRSGLRRSKLVSASVVVAIAIAGSAACSASQPAPLSLELDRAEQAILNGQPDTTHDAVVFLLSGTAACTGTIIKVDATAKVGWVLTAAHCVVGDGGKPVFAYQGANADPTKGATKRYAVIDAVAHTGYNPNGFARDFGMVRIAGVDATTPVLPAATSTDGLAIGRTVLSVGYGRTTPADVANPESNTVRRAISKPIADLNAAQIVYSQAPANNPSGICSGDSGGPVVATVNGAERVVGVHSFVSNDCRTAGYSGRVTSELAWLNARLSDPLPALNSCAACKANATSGNGKCAARFEACINNVDCGGLYKCVIGCPNAICQRDCYTKYPLGTGPLIAALGDTCPCVDACAAQCATDPTCRDASACGYAVNANSCGRCQAQKCCAETAAAAADGAAYQCLESLGRGAGCQANALYTGIQKCEAAKCPTECGVAAPVDPAPEPEPEPTPQPAPPAAAATSGGGCALARTQSSGADGTCESAWFGLMFIGIAGIALRRRQRGAL